MSRFQKLSVTAAADLLRRESRATCSPAQPCEIFVIIIIIINSKATFILSTVGSTFFKLFNEENLNKIHKSHWFGHLLNMQL